MSAKVEDGETKPGSKPLPAILIKRGAILFLVIDTVAAFLWAVGSYTYFLDETQSMLLRAIRISSLLLFVDALAGAVAAVAYAIAGRRLPSLAALLAYAGCLATGAAGLVFSDALLLLGRGLLP